MSDKSENIRSLNAGSLLSMLIMALGLLIWHNPCISAAGIKKNLSTTELSISLNSATVYSGLRTPVFQMTWIYNKDTFKIISFPLHQFLESKKTDLIISLLQIIREKTDRIPDKLFMYHLFPCERDELPLLS